VSWYALTMRPPRSPRPSRLSEQLEEAVVAKAGEIRKRADGDYQKQRDGTWKRVPARGDKGAAKKPTEWKPPKNADEAMAAKDAPLPVGRKWIDHAPGLPKSTQDAFKDSDTGQYAPERQILHENIIDNFLSKGKSVPKDMKPVTLFMLGTTASGKSTARKNLEENPFGDYTPVEVDPDAIKGMIPEYQKAVEASAKDAAMMAHEESSDIAKELQRRAVAKRMNVIVDGTGANLSSMRKKILASKEAGHHATALMPHVVAEECVRRAEARAEKTGRYVPRHIVEDCAAKVGKNFLELTKDFDSFHLFDNHEKKPRLIMKAPPKPPKIVDAALFEKFKKDNGILEHRTLLRGAWITEQKENVAVDLARLPSWYKSTIVAEDETEAVMEKRFDLGDGVEEVLGD